MSEVTLAEYAFVRAGLEDGLPLEELLVYARLDAALWMAGEAIWRERVLDALEAHDMVLVGDLARESESARRRWRRAVPPVDSDLRAWFDYLHGLANAEDALAFLKRTGGDIAIVAHVHRLWSERFASNDAARREAERLLAQEPGEPPILQAEPPRLLARLESLNPVRDGRPPTAVAETTDLREDRKLTDVEQLPFVEVAELDVDDSPPSLAVPLPVLEPDLMDHGTESFRFIAPPVLATPLPFHEPEVPAATEQFSTADLTVPVRPEAGSVQAASTKAAEAPAMSAPILETLDLGDSPPPPSKAEVFETVELGAAPVSGVVLPFVPVSGGRLPLEVHAALHAELHEGEGHAKDILALYGLTEEEKRAEDRAWGRKLDASPAVRTKWFQAFVAASDRLKKEKGGK